MNTERQIEHMKMYGMKDIQRSVLGRLIISPSLAYKIAPILPPVMFDQEFEGLAALMYERARTNAPAPISEIALLFPGIAEPSIQKACTCDELEHLAIRVRDEWLLMTYRTEIAQHMKSSNAPDADYWMLRAELEYRCKKLEESFFLPDSRLDDVTETAKKVAHELKNGTLPGVPSGFADLDELMGGWVAGELTYIGARPSMGKTTWLCSTALAAAEAGTPVLYISMGDMSKRQLYTKLAAMLAGVDPIDIRRRTLQADGQERLWKGFERLSELDIHILDAGTISRKIGPVQDAVRRYKEQHGIGISIFDYVQQFSPDDVKGKNRDAQMGEISAALKNMAVALDIPVLAASQLSRQPETRGGQKRPQMSDLRESGNLEQDADNIFFIYRPEQYGITENEFGESLRGVSELILSKYRAVGELVTFMHKMQNGRIVSAQSIPTGTQFPGSVPQMNGKKYDETDVPF